MLVRTGGEVLACLADILLDPLKSFDLIFQAIVQTPFRLNLLARQESIRPDSVVEGDDNDVLSRSLDQTCPVVIGVGVGIEPSTLDPEVDWQARRIRWCEDI